MYRNVSFTVSSQTMTKAKPSKVDLVGVGLNATDMLIPMAEHPVPGSKVEFRSASVLPGGQVASAVMACQQWGLRTRYVGKLGNELELYIDVQPAVWKEHPEAVLAPTKPLRLKLPDGVPA